MSAAAWDDAEDWRAELQQAGVPAHLYPQAYQNPEGQALEAVKFAIVWKPPARLLAQCSNLAAVHSLGAGVDSILADGTMPAGVPLARIVRDHGHYMTHVGAIAVQSCSTVAHCCERDMLSCYDGL